MSLKQSKWKRKHIPIVHLFEEQAEKTREQNTDYWAQMSLPKHKPRRQQKHRKGSHNTIKERMKSLAYKQTEERDEGYCVVCGTTGEQHHHIVKQSTRYGPQYIQRMENIVLVCATCHVEIHNPKGKSMNQIYLEEWQQRYYPEYSAMMKEMAKITGCRDQWLIDRWDRNNQIKTTQQEVAK